MHLNMNLPAKQRGVGLIEVLIAVLVLSFGMLGLAGLQSYALRSNQSALERGMATVQTHSIVDAMRADRVAATTTLYNIDLDDATPTGTSFRDQAIARWRTDLQAALNSTATGAIDCDGALCTITVQWNDERAGGAEAQTIVTEVRL